MSDDFNDCGLEFIKGSVKDLLAACKIYIFINGQTSWQRKNAGANFRNGKSFYMAYDQNFAERIAGVLKEKKYVMRLRT